MYGQAVKTPVKINFYEWDGNKIPLLLWVDLVGGKLDQSLFKFEDPHGNQKTLCCTITIPSAGECICCPGDIIIQGVNGGYYPCKRETFNKIYEITKTGDHRVFRMMIIVSAFPGCGKSYCFQHGKSLITHDSDSSDFHFIKKTREPNPEWPDNYIKHIMRLKSRGYYDVVFVSSHAEIRKALKKAGLRYLLVYPENDCKSEYLQRYRNRGSSAAFVERLETNWQDWLQSCRDDDAAKLVLSRGVFLTEECLISVNRSDIIKVLC
jgi:hypothetical protein